MSFFFNSIFQRTFLFPFTSSRSYSRFLLLLFFFFNKYEYFLKSYEYFVESSFFSTCVKTLCSSCSSYNITRRINDVHSTHLFTFPRINKMQIYLVIYLFPRPNEETRSRLPAQRVSNGRYFSHSLSLSLTLYHPTKVSTYLYIYIDFYSTYYVGTRACVAGFCRDIFRTDGRVYKFLYVLHVFRMYTIRITIQQ